MRSATVRLATGPSLHYTEDGSPEGDALLLLHGWPDSGFSFSRVMPLLPREYRLIAPDQRGFGDSVRPGRGYGIADFVADAAAFLDAVGVERATIVGHSFGSFVARGIAAAHPRRVTRLALIGSGPKGAVPVVLEARAALADLPDPVPVEFAREFQAGTIFLPLPEPFFERVVAESCKAPARVWRDVLEGLVAFEDAAALARIACPTLLLWGDRDALFSRDDQERLLAGLPNARLEVYADTGHCPNWERPERVAADLAAFLRES